jgi:hypothetical protein
VLRWLEERSVAPAVAGVTVIARGQVAGIEDLEDGRLISCELTMSTQVGLEVVRGSAGVFLPATERAAE